MCLMAKQNYRFIWFRCDSFIFKGAYRTLEIARQIKATCVVLKENSPSCGSQKFIMVLFKVRKLRELESPQHFCSATALK